MHQTFTSASTSINSARLPSVYRRADFSALFVFDYGCGKYTDHIDDYLRQGGRVLIPFDPFNQPSNINYEARRFVHFCIGHGFPLDVVCSNVLNVIDSETSIKTIAWNIENIITKTGGHGYITVYEGDRSGTGKQTGKDQYQRNEPLRNYLRFFRNATIKNNMIVVGQ